jgi:hypothetical protein
MLLKNSAERETLYPAPMTSKLCGTPAAVHYMPSPRQPDNRSMRWLVPANEIFVTSWLSPSACPL